MKKLLALAAIAIVFSNSALFAKYSGGTGEPNDPYLIATPNDLNSIGLDPNDWDKHFLLIADINMASVIAGQYNIIGNEMQPFIGVFDGNNRSISNVLISMPLEDNVGLFGYIGADSKICYLSLENITASGIDHIGSLAGYNYYGMIDSIIVKSDVTGIGNAAGGLLGYNYGGTIINCQSETVVKGEWANLGGLVGRNENGTIVNCRSRGSVIQTIEDVVSVGGLVGCNLGNVTSCFSSATVSGGWYVGGLAGQSNQGTFTNSYSTGPVSGYNYVGGLIGYKYQGMVSFCYSTGSVQGTSNIVGGLIASNSGIVISGFWDIITSGLTDPQSGQIDTDGMIGLPTSEMQNRITFAETGWDMVNIWDIGENQTYPFLRKHLPSDINKDNETNFLDLVILAEHWLEGI